jgi:opacity protein-like surface antigen
MPHCSVPIIDNLPKLRKRDRSVASRRLAETPSPYDQGPSFFDRWHNYSWRSIWIFARDELARPNRLKFPHWSNEVIMSCRIGIVVLSFAFANVASAQGGDRTGTWEAGFNVSDFSSESLAGNAGSGLELDSELGYGITVNYNVSSRFAVGVDWTYSSPDYQATRIVDGSNVPDRIDATLDVSTLHLKATFYFTEGALAPFIEGGAGWTRVDSNIADGPPTNGCWWDPWWGYVCSSFYDTYTETRTSYSYGLGLRWEISDEFVVRGSYGLLEVDTKKSEDPSLDVLRVDFGWRF